MNVGYRIGTLEGSKSIWAKSYIRNIATSVIEALDEASFTSVVQVDSLQKFSRVSYL